MRTPGLHLAALMGVRPPQAWRCMKGGHPPPQPLPAVQQTLFALVAIFAFSFFALNQHRAGAALEQRALGGEAEVAAMSVAREHVARLTRLPFDEADLAATAIRQTTAGLTDALGPETGEATPAAYDDLDDYHGFAETVAVDWNGAPLRFDVAVTVRYVDRLSPADPAAVPTLAKELVVTVTEAAPPAEGRPPATAAFRQIVTPAWSFFQR